MTELENRSILLHFVCRAFGYEDVRAMLNQLRDISPDFESGGESNYAQVLSHHATPAFVKVTPEQLTHYDANIAAHSRKLRMTSTRGRVWKPHQYLALLFTEYYLDRYFDSAEKFRADMNKARAQNQSFRRTVSDYTPDELRTVAFQSATGSGKTLIMHAHILQYQYWLKRAGERLNNIILLTPNEQMSLQHQRELHESGLEARLFSNRTSGDIFRRVEIIDLNKLAEKRGVKRVAVKDFGENNLVLVDEGHLGATGKVWRELRGELARGGFTFEYSATFNQIIKKTKDKNTNGKSLLKMYGKCLLFDYSYRAFYEDGYGKDYSISNLPQGTEDASSDLYLLGCLLTFYRQSRIWRDKGGDWKRFNLTKPLWVFLGKTVIGKSKVDQQARTDVVRILDFLGWFIARGDEVRPMLTRLLAGESELVDEAGNDYFAGRFDDLRNSRLDALYDDICETLFHGRGKLRVRYLTTGEGELHLRVAENDTFGVINVGDSKALYDMLRQNANPDFIVERESGFVEKLFNSVDRPDSTINVVVGARRFIAGWNSWRVSTMGLMHVGVGEGPEIIQMFGRGVRLKGWNMSLKRHRESGAPVPEGSEKLAELETLHIFGLRANYMQNFRDLLQAEGIRAERETVELPVTWNFSSETDLKMIRLDAKQKYEYSDERVVLSSRVGADTPTVKMDLYSHVQAVASDNPVDDETIDKNSARLESEHVAFFDKTRIYERLLAQKRLKGWYNLVIEPQTVEALLANGDWYELYAPTERMDMKSFENLRELEDVAVNLLTEYADRFWRKQRRQWESDRIQVTPLQEDDPNNIEAYQLSVDAAKGELVKGVRELAAHPEYQPARTLKMTAISTDAHAYKPLLHKAKDCEVTIQPVALDDNEKKVVDKLIKLARGSKSFLQGRELFLIRNLTRGRGMSFFGDYAYYPDFIVWLKKNDEQHVIFLDPKGLVIYGPRERRKVELHTEIKETEAQIRKTDPNLFLHAYILSVTPPAKISDQPKTKPEWAEQGVYFLDDNDCLEQIIKKVLEHSPADPQTSPD